MKCPKCSGAGYIYNNLVGYTEDCFVCHGKGELLTNEEWFAGLSTKEKAKWLFKLTYKCYWCGREYTPRSPSLYNEKECPFHKCLDDSKGFEEWLKEKHDEM